MTRGRANVHLFSTRRGFGRIRLPRPHTTLHRSVEVASLENAYISSMYNAQDARLPQVSRSDVLDEAHRGEEQNT